MNEETKKLPAENKEVSKTDDENKLIKRNERLVKIKRISELFCKDYDPSNSSTVGAFVDLLEKKTLTPDEKKRKDELESELSKANGLKNGLWVNNLSYERHYKFLATTRSDFVKEYECKTPIELMLADRIVANYWRSMRLDMTLNRLIEQEEGGYSFNDSKIYAISELNKGLESASRQLNTSILLLKELKQPKLNIKVTTENAFIGQNQQFNANQQGGHKQDETIEPK